MVASLTVLVVGCLLIVLAAVWHVHRSQSHPLASQPGFGAEAAIIAVGAAMIVLGLWVGG